MASRRVNEPKAVQTLRRPATTPKGRENQIIADAMDLAQKQILEGTASAQVVTHFLKLGSSREKLEQARITEDIELAKAKKEQMASTIRTEELMKQAIEAFRSYAGEDPLMITETFDD